MKGNNVPGHAKPCCEYSTIQFDYNVDMERQISIACFLQMISPTHEVDAQTTQHRSHEAAPGVRGASLYRFPMLGCSVLPLMSATQPAVACAYSKGKGGTVS